MMPLRPQLITKMTTSITETLLNPPTAIATGGSSILLNTFVVSLPTLINVAMAVYLTVLIAHKSWQFYNEIRDRRNASSKQVVSGNS